MPSPVETLRRGWHLTRTLVGFLRASEILGSPPTHLWLEPTSACNLKCIHCPTGIGSTRPRGFMDFELARRLLDEAAEFRPLVYFHLGGESLMHPRLADMIRHASTAGLPTALFTNATLLDRARGEALLGAGLRWLGFSMDGLDRESYERVRKGGKFERVIENLFEFLRLKRERGSTTPYTYVSTVDLDGSASSPAGADLASRLRAAGLDHLEVVQPHTWAGLALSATATATATATGNSQSGALPPNPRQGRSSPLDPPVTGESLAPARKTESSEVPNEPRPARCPAPWSGLAILWDGTAVPCCLDLEGRLPVGSVRDLTLAQVWNGDPLRRLRQAFASRRWDQLPAICQACHIPREKTILGVPVKVVTELKEEWLGL
jgi:MoaA/NifB/PqqE/SkfB family radical SAM enzyme